MSLRTPAEMLLERICQFTPDHNNVGRVLALYAASIATGNDDVMSEALGLGRAHGVQRGAFNEVVLQSYLFLGFPRMLIAVELLNRDMPMGQKASLRLLGSDELQIQYEKGLALCREIYGTAFEPLRSRIEAYAPEVFQWMIVEGYGKVMGRPGLGKVERELASVAFLIMEGYEQQLYSHVRGALNIGATPELLYAVIDDVGTAGGEGTEIARRIMQKFDR